MAAKKKTTKKKTARKTTSKTTLGRPAASPPRNEAMEKLEGRLAALEAQADVGRELRELRLALLPALDSYRMSTRAQGGVGGEMPYVLLGVILTILIIVGVLGFNGALSGDATAILLGGPLLYAIWKGSKYLLD